MPEHSVPGKEKIAAMVSNHLTMDGAVARKPTLFLARLHPFRSRWPPSGANVRFGGGDSEASQQSFPDSDGHD